MHSLLCIIAAKDARIEELESTVVRQAEAISELQLRVGPGKPPEPKRDNVKGWKPVARSVARAIIDHNRAGGKPLFPVAIEDIFGTYNRFDKEGFRYHGSQEPLP